jgi:hypothetical protein
MSTQVTSPLQSPAVTPTQESSNLPGAPKTNASSMPAGTARTLAGSQHAAQQSATMPAGPITNTVSTPPGTAGTPTGTASAPAGIQASASGAAPVPPQAVRRRRRERAVPASPLGRVFGFAQLGASLMYGSVADSVVGYFRGTERPDNWCGTLLLVSMTLFSAC